MLLRSVSKNSTLAPKAKPMLQSLFNLLYPKICCGCRGLLLESEPELCTACRHNLPFTLHHNNPDNEVVKKLYGRLPLVHASAMVYFVKEGMVQEMLHNLKYRGRENISGLLGQWYAQDLKGIAELQTVTDVVPVPLHKKRLRERGYNQSAAFAREIARGLGAAYNDTLLVRTGYSKTQTKKNLAARTGIATAFALSQAEKPHERHYLLVDDVMTTGATLEACGRELLKVPGARLSIVTIAYAQ